MRQLRILVLACALVLAGCSEKLWVIKPFDVSKSNQVAMANFAVKEQGDYQFSLLFVWKEGREEMEEQEEIIGSGGYVVDTGEPRPGVNEGIPIPLKVRLIKDGEIVVDECLVTSGKDYGQAFDHEGRTKSAAGRVIKTITLEPGNYFVEVRTIKETKEFAGNESYIKFAYFKPKI